MASGAKLLDLSLLETVTELKKGCFSECKTLEVVRLCNMPNFKTIGASAFAKCSSLQFLFYEGSPLEAIEEHAFSNSGLLSFCFAASAALQRIGVGAFAHCERLTEVELVRIAGMRVVDSTAFQQCTSLERVLVEDLPRLCSVGERCFAQCTKLRNVRFAHLPRPCQYWLRSV